MGWHPIGHNIDYQKSYVNRDIIEPSPVYKSYYTLSFTIDFKKSEQTVYLALNYPYTYTRMVNFLKEIETNCTHHL